MTPGHPQKITFGEMRASGVRDVLVYCRDHHCSHHIRISADFWPDHLRLSDIEDRFVCRSAASVARISDRIFRKAGWVPASRTDPKPC
jgi:hypothetical protein